MRGHISPEEHATTRTPATDPNVDVGLSHGTGPSTNSDPGASSSRPNRRGNHPKPSISFAPITTSDQKWMQRELKASLLSYKNKPSLRREAESFGRETLEQSWGFWLWVAPTTPGLWKDSTQDLEEGGGPSCAGAEKPAGWMGGRCFISSLFSSIRSKFFRPWALLIDLQNPTEQAMGTASPGGTWVY